MEDGVLRLWGSRAQLHRVPGTLTPPGWWEKYVEAPWVGIVLLRIQSGGKFQGEKHGLTPASRRIKTDFRGQRETPNAGLSGTCVLRTPGFLLIPIRSLKNS